MYKRMRIAVSTPVYITTEEHKNYLDLTTRSIYSADHDIVFIPVENYVAPQFLPLPYAFVSEPESIHIVVGRQPQGVSKAWNDGIKKAAEFECDYVLVINQDIVFKSNCIDRLVAFAEAHPEAVMWTASPYSDLGLLEEAGEDEGFVEHPHFSCYMVKPNFFKEVGKFDENFMPAYLEDGDMHARIALANKKAYIYGGARFYHFGSTTIKSDQEEWQKNTLTFPQNQQRFLDKWGHPPVGDVEQMREVYYKTPYNIEGVGLDYQKEGGEE